MAWQCICVSQVAWPSGRFRVGVDWLALAQVLAAQRMLESKYNEAARGADDWGRRAELAVRSNNDDLAREALRRKKAFAVWLPPHAPCCGPAASCCQLRGIQAHSQLPAALRHAISQLVVQLPNEPAGKRCSCIACITLVITTMGFEHG